MSRSSALALLTMAMLFPFHPTLATAETVRVNGEAGAWGTPGADGIPGLPGGPGQEGGSAIAIADTPGEDNTADARGGRGGQGGPGGDATPNSGANGGNGGAGGRGGDAFAEATTAGSALLRAIARGGDGGSGGAGGSGSPPGLPGQPGTPGGDGGDATATGQLTYDLGMDAPFFRADGLVDALGGRGSGDAGAGGSAEATLVGEITGGNASQSATHLLRAFATGGDASFQSTDTPVPGGSATAEVEGTTSHGSLLITADANGGRSASHPPEVIPGPTGDATAIAHGVHTGEGFLGVTAKATAGDGDGLLGRSRAVASGLATEGADVTVEASAFGGVDPELRNAVSGSTSGLLTLIQQVRADISGLVTAGVDAITSLTATNPGGGDLAVEVTAGGGIGASPGGDGGDGIIEFIDATGEQNVTVAATAIGGRGGQSFDPLMPPGAGGTASIESVFGRSTGGGDVVVEATASGGSIGARGGRLNDGILGGPAGNASLDNAVDGETTGSLTLRQFATAGGTHGPDPKPPAIAMSRLERTRSAEQFTIHSEAEGLAAEAFGSATNLAGDVLVEVVATGSGGLGGSGTGLDGVDGGRATSNALGTTHHDGHAVVVGDDDLINARGGDGVRRTDLLVFGDGGSASSSSSGVALGDSQVSVYDRAEGGSGGTDTATFILPEDHAGTSGGAASARASASNAGASLVFADARAIGGMGGNSRGVDQLGGRGGDAEASADGRSTGGADVTVRAEATGGQGGYRRSDDWQAGRGGDAAITGMTGSTSGHLTLEAIATGGRGGTESLSSNRSIGLGGNAHLEVDATNEGGGALTIRAEGTTTRGGQVTLGTIRGASSNGADVSVAAVLDLGAVSPADASTGEIPDSARSFSLIDAVQGETTGLLHLLQDLSGGGDGGTFENQLSRSGDHAGLSLETFTEAREGANAISRTIATNGLGFATAESESRTNAGSDAISEAVALGGGNEETRAVAISRLNGTSGGGVVESAARAESTGAGPVRATATSTGRAGADVSATAHAQSDGAESVTVLAIASSSLEGAERLMSSADGSSTGGGDVSVTARVSRTDALRTDAVTELANAVSGGTAGRLTLAQQLSSRNGDVRTSLDAENTGGGNLRLDVDASALRNFGFGVSTEGGDVILGDVIGRSDTGANVEVDVFATGNAIRRETTGDPLSTSQIIGISTRGEVDVRAEFLGTAGSGSIISETGMIGADGNSIDMDNVVNGFTEGDLSLVQIARGGSAPTIAPPFTSPNIHAQGGTGGIARSHLEKTGAFRTLYLEGESHGGGGGALSGANQGRAGDGGLGEVHLVAENTMGRAEIQGSAQGGTGGHARFVTGAGGDAVIESRATTTGNDRAVVIGRDESTGGPINAATGGRGGNIGIAFSVPTPDPAIAGDGGNAASRSEGRAHGDSTVDIFDRARGGSGGNGNLFTFLPRGSGGRGGTARSEAIAVGAGRSRASAYSDALGGAGGENLLTQGHGGDAFAFALADGRGEVEATSIARGGATSTNVGQAGSAYARTDANGKTGQAVADATTGSGSFGVLRSSVTRDVRKRTRLDAVATYGAPVPTLARDVEGSAFLAGNLPSQVLLAATNVTGSLESILEETPGAIVETVGGWQARNTAHADSFQATQLDITLAPPDSNDDLLLAIFDIQTENGGFEELNFRLEVFGQAFGEEATFVDADAAREYFASAIVLGAAYLDGPITTGVPAIRAIFEVATSATQSISIGIAAVVVPEPSTGVLIGVGLVVLARRRSRPNG